MSAFFTKIGLWLTEKLGLKFFQWLWRKIREQPETKVKHPSGLEVTFKGAEAPGVYINDGIERFLAMPIRTPSGLPEVVEAKRLMESGEREKAEAKMRELLSKPTPALEAPSEEQAFVAALRLLDEGDSKFDADDFDGAEKAYRKAGEMATKSSNELLQSLCLSLLGAAIGMQDRDGEALACFEEVTRLKPDLAEGWYNKGTALSKLGRDEEALPCFDEAVKIDGNFLDAWLHKGVALAKLDRNEQALACFDEAIRLDENCGVAWLNKGLALVAIGRIEESVTPFGKAVEIDTNDARSWYNKGVSLVMLERYEESIICFDKAAEIDESDAAPWYNKGFALAKLQKEQEALACFHKAAEINENLADAWYNQAILLGRLGLYKEAKRSFKKTFSLKDHLSDNGAALYHAWTNLILTYARVHLQLGNVGTAKNLAKDFEGLKQKSERDGMGQIVKDTAKQFKAKLPKGEAKKLEDWLRG